MPGPSEGVSTRPAVCRAVLREAPCISTQQMVLGTQQSYLGKDALAEFVGSPPISPAEWTHSHWDFTFCSTGIPQCRAILLSLRSKLGMGP